MRTDLDLRLRDEPGPDPEDDALVLEEGSDGALHERAAAANAIVDLVLEGALGVLALHSGMVDLNHMSHERFTGFDCRLD